MNNIEKEKYLNQAISLLDTQERKSEAEYRAAFQKLGEELYRRGITKFYKYRSNETWKRDSELWEENKIWMSSMDEVNDIFEFPVKFDFNHMGVPDNEDLKREFLSVKSRCGVFSMCERVDNLLLWAQYSNSHQGYCIEYDAVDVLNAFQYSVLPVLYKSDFISVSIFLEKVDKNIAPTALAIRSVVSKGMDWINEEEWRCVRVWEEKVEGKKVHFPKPTAIYLGCKVNDEFENKMIEFCKKKHIDLYKMKKSDEAFQIKPMKLEL